MGVTPALEQSQKSCNAPHDRIEYVLDALQNNKTSMPTLNRLHHSGSNADIQLDSDGWNVVVNVREPGHTERSLGVFLLPSLLIAKRLADRQLFKCGHSCSQSCTRWEVFGEVPRRSASGSRSTTQERRPLFASLRTAAGLLTPILKVLRSL
jgi:hypothetical protein